MSSVCLIDTSIFLNLLDVPNCNESKEKVTEDFKTYVEAGCTFLLPMVTIVETGNHIAQNGDGNIRRTTAQRFVVAVKAAFSGEAPWQPVVFPDMKEILSWIEEFPDFAGRNKAHNKPEGTSFGDLSIIREFDKACDRFEMSEVFIWSLDSDLQSYHQQPR
ncbi:hypothetical protein [Coleofasciculus sp.]|uniref:hypothetical protein n=1 Tax=Coleofasciculus sp. TaxID=3100458 RepID=UPI0039F78264